MSNLGTIHALQGMGVEVVRSAVGDRYVIQEMIKADAVLGGEPSGHVIFLDYNPTGDGLVSALQVLRIMIETGSSLSDLAQIVKKYPQVLVNVEVHQKIPLEKLPQVTAEIARVEGLLKDQGRVLVRYSGTENLCRIMIEGPKLKFIQECAQSIAKVLESEIGAGK
jgi:Phosphomannomutase